MTPAAPPFGRVLAMVAGAVLFLLAIAVESGHAFGWVPTDVLASLGASALLDPPGRHTLAVLALALAALWGADRALANGVGAAAYVIAGILVAPVAAWPWMGQAPAIVSAVALLTFILSGRGSPRWRLTAFEARWRGTAAWERWLAVLGVILAVVAVLGEMRELRNVIARQSDFGTFYRAAEAVRDGGDPYQVANREYFYPPTFAIAMIPITWVTIAHASVIWFVLKCAMVVASLRMTYQLLEGSQLSGKARAGFAFGVVLVACRFWMTDLKFGNTNIVTLFLSLLALRAGERGKDTRAGLWLAIATSIKLVPAVLGVWFLARRRFRILAWLGIWLLAINLLPLVLGPARVAGLWSSYGQHGVEQRIHARLDEPDNQSLRGLFERTTPKPAVTTLGWAYQMLIFAFGVAMATWWLVLPTMRSRSIAAGVFFLVGLMVSPGSWVVHYIAVLLPMAGALCLLLVPGGRRALLGIAFGFATLVYTGSALARVTVRLAADQSLFVFATLLLLVALMVELRRITPRSGAPSARPATPPPPPPDRR